MPAAVLPGVALAMSAMSELSRVRSSGGSGMRQNGLADARRRASTTSAARSSVAHDADVALAEGDDLRPGERGDVDDRVGLLLARGDEAVGQHEPALGVGVDHLDGGAAPDGEHVVGADRGRRRACSRRCRATRSRATGSASSAAASVTARTVAAPVMSYFMPTIAPAGLSDSPPVSNVMPLPTRARCFAAPAGAYCDLDQAGRARGSLPDAEDAAEAARRGVRRPSSTVTVTSSVAEQADGLVGECGRREVDRGSRDEVADGVHGLAPRLRASSDRLAASIGRSP